MIYTVGHQILYLLAYRSKYPQPQHPCRPKIEIQKYSDGKFPVKPLVERSMMRNLKNSKSALGLPTAPCKRLDRRIRTVTSEQIPTMMGKYRLSDCFREQATQALCNRPMMSVFALVIDSRLRLSSSNRLGWSIMEEWCHSSCCV